MVFCPVLLLILVLLESEGAQPPGLTSLRKCNKYYNLTISEKDFSPLTTQDIEKLNEDEVDNLIHLEPVFDDDIRQFPFMAALGYKDGSSKKVFLCGGTLISELFILTAAHCFVSQRIELVRLGDLNLTSSADDMYSQEFQVRDVFVHPNYNFPQKYNDIALIKLHKPAIFTRNVLPACLEPKREDVRVKTLYILGWGGKGPGEDFSDHLQVARVRLNSIGNCQKTFPSDFTIPESIKTESQICAGGYGINRTGTCERDSGGPLAYVHLRAFRNLITEQNTFPKTYIYLIAGVTSSGKSCTTNQIPGIYTRVSHYTDWIENIVWPDDKLESSEKANYECVQPPGLTSLRKCNKYYNITISDKDFSPLTMQEIEKLNEYELDIKPSTLITAGGVNALPKQLPFMAALGYKDGSSKKFFCGGTLISELFILTAAHCLASQKIEFVRLGDLNLTSSADDVDSQEFQAGDVFVHPNYKYPQKYNDIALVKLHRPAIFTSSVSPACLEPKRDFINHEDFYIAGWGRLGFGEDISDHLQVGKLRLNSMRNCQSKFPRDFSIPESIKPESQVCAVGRGVNLTDSCEGDSGGPLVYKHGKAYFHQVFEPYIYPNPSIYIVAGITSFGKPCAIDQIPGIYTRVSHYTDWIENIVWPDDKFESLENSNDGKIYFPLN